MLPIVTPAEMRDIDREAPEPVEELIARAGFATARAARRLLGATYGRRVAVLAGPGNNGADGRSAAALLARAGARCRVLDPAGAPHRLAGADLVIDAAYGTGFRGELDPPVVGGTPVLAVDIPSGVDGLTGRVGGRALAASATVTFAALKPGLLLGDGPALSGPVEVVDIGLDVSRASAWLLQSRDLARWPVRRRDSHKWRAACWVVGGSPGMTGAPRLAAHAAQRAGAGYVRLGVPGVPVGEVDGPVEVVGIELPATGWAGVVLDGHERVAAFVLGPGLGTAPGTEDEVRRLLDGLPRPVVLDGDGLRAVDGRPEVLRRRPAPTVLTPHDGELARLTGAPPGGDRLAASRDLAARSGAVVLLKGPATVVADPSGRVLVSTAGDARLATAGTGDVLAGIIGALLAQGVEPWLAAGLGAEVHGRAARLGPAGGLVAGDLADLVPAAVAAGPVPAGLGWDRPGRSTRASGDGAWTGIPVR